MFKSIAFCRHLIKLNQIKPQYLCPSVMRHMSSDNKPTDDSIVDELLNNSEEKSAENMPKEETLTFAKAFEKFEKLAEESNKPKKTIDNYDTETFPSLLRYSTFIQMGDPEGKVVVGKIEDIVDDDLYIDFGAKFNAVCKRPKTNESDYVRGAKVRLRINDLELSDRFLGSHKDMTLLEADATLMGIIWSPNRSVSLKDQPEV